MSWSDAPRRDLGYAPCFTSSVAPNRPGVDVKKHNEYGRLSVDSHNDSQQSTAYPQ